MRESKLRRKRPSLAPFNQKQLVGPDQLFKLCFADYLDSQFLGLSEFAARLLARHQIGGAF